MGDLGSAPPLVTRLRAAGTRVVAVGATPGSADVRHRVDVYLDLRTLEHTSIENTPDDTERDGSPITEPPLRSPQSVTSQLLDATG